MWTYGKPAAEFVLVTPKTDPLLAVQRYGLGRTAAFTSDLSARWGRTGCAGHNSVNLSPS